MNHGAASGGIIGPHCISEVSWRYLLKNPYDTRAIIVRHDLAPFQIDVDRAAARRDVGFSSAHGALQQPALTSSIIRPKRALVRLDFHQSWLGNEDFTNVVLRALLLHKSYLYHINHVM